MIRVNLLTSVQDRATMVDGRWRTATPAVVVVLAIPSLALAAWWYWSLHSEAGNLVRALADAETALARLAPDVDAARTAEALQADLAARVGLIEALHVRRGAPARLLDQLSRALPNGLWLNEVRQEPSGVVVRGHAGTLATVSDYAVALEAWAAPGTRVEIVDAQWEKRSSGPETVAFEIRMPIPAGDGR